MAGGCRWTYSSEARLCVFPACDKEGRFTCIDHPWEGHFCLEHRIRHTGQWRERRAMMDSRPAKELQKGQREVEAPVPPQTTRKVKVMDNPSLDGAMMVLRDIKLRMKELVTPDAS